MLYVRNFEDNVLKEESLQWTAALGCRSGMGRLTFDTLHAANFSPTEAVSAWRGFLLGLIAYERSQMASPGPSSEPAAKPVGQPPKQQL